jgi:hypothetical protein
MEHIWGEKIHTGFWWGHLNERDHLEDSGVDRGIILRRVFGKYVGGCMDWIELAQDRDRWWTLINAVMNFRVPYNAGIFLTNCKPVSFS